MKHRSSFLLIVLMVGWAFFLICCVSQTVHEQRFSERESLAPPTITVTLPDPENFTFAAVGDLHISNKDTARLGRILTAAAAEGDAFIVVLGDIVDKGAREDVIAFHQALSDTGFTGRVLPVLGNHDIFYNGWDSYKEFNGAATYSVTIGNSNFIVLDTADGSLGQGQRAWLKTEIAKNVSKHLFLASHYLPVIPRQKTYLKLANDVEAIGLMKLASENHVTAWLGGHYHSYIVGRAENVDYVVAGGGGGRRMDPVREFFFAQVKVAGDSVTYSMKKVD